MTTPSVKAQMPKSVRQALVGVWIQAVLNLVVGFLLVALVSDGADHGREDGAGLIRFLAVVSLVIAGVLLLCGVFAERRLKGIRVTVIVIEALGVLIGVVGVFQGEYRFSRASSSPSSCCGA